MAFTGIAQGQRVPEDQERGNVMEHVMAVKESKKREKQKQGKKWEGKKIKTGGGRSFPGAFSILLCLGGVRKSATDDLKDWVGESSERRKDGKRDLPNSIGTDLGSKDKSLSHARTGTGPFPVASRGLSVVNCPRERRQLVPTSWKDGKGKRCPVTLRPLNPPTDDGAESDIEKDSSQEVLMHRMQKAVTDVTKPSADAQDNIRRPDHRETSSRSELRALLDSSAADRGLLIEEVYRLFERIVLVAQRVIIDELNDSDKS
ncbi:hypothetical protein VTN49DRAFT_1912 [Thermomyces lanuginosus]|uniref:uncharacterized protein n=1 Tax=Thermomyces lanuginosus TaxID=5541 RepID=UPI00374495D5